MPIDFKKEKKDPYNPKTALSVIEVPEMLFIVIDSKGDPNTSAEYAVDNGYTPDINDTRRHHEIYISDLRKTASEKLKTVIRHPVRRT